jgi:hypothetical protein
MDAETVQRVVQDHLGQITEMLNTPGQPLDLEVVSQWQAGLEDPAVGSALLTIAASVFGSQRHTDGEEQAFISGLFHGFAIGVRAEREHQ